MTGADWIWGLAALCELSGQSVYLLGSEPPIAPEAAERLSRWYLIDSPVFLFRVLAEALSAVPNTLRALLATVVLPCRESGCLGREYRDTLAPLRS